MKNKLFLMLSISALGISLTGCSASFSAGNGSANTTKPANVKTAASPAAHKPGTVVQNEKKPEGTAKTANKEVPVPADWVYFYDEQKGYGFSMPAGTTSENIDSNGIDVTSLTTPSGIDIFTLAYKDKTLTKEDLLKDAVTFLEGLGQKVTPGTMKAESDDYAVADATTVTEDGGKGKLRIMAGTDVTDNYVMILGTDTDKFAANEKIIDEIWGSFEMWSGGSSGSK